jgi:hypothetical protein
MIREFWGGDFGFWILDFGFWILDWGGWGGWGESVKFGYKHWYRGLLSVLSILN